MTKLIEFNTERLRLRQWNDVDRAPFASLNADPRVMEFFPRPLDRESSDVMADRIQSQIAERGWGLWAVEIRESKKFIGFIGLNIPPPELPFSPCIEIGWRLAVEYWGKGYAVEGARGALRVGFEMLALPEIVSFAALGNVRSRAVMKKLGMLDTGTVFEHPLLDENAPLREHCLYRLSLGQWQGIVS